MAIQIDLKSPNPVYQQIIDEIRYQVARGIFQPGDRLPTIRDLATELRVNRNTVMKAYRELESQNVILTRPGLGTTISESVSRVQKSEKIKILKEKATSLVVEAFHLQVSEKDLRSVFQESIEEIYLNGAKG